MQTHLKTHEEKVRFAEEVMNAEGVVCVEIEESTEKRYLTYQQLKSLNLYCSWLAKALNEAGYDMKTVMKVKEIPLPWTQATVKECFWREIQKLMLEKLSTKDIKNLEVSEIYEAVNQVTTNKFGIHVPFPDKNNLREGE